MYVYAFIQDDDENICRTLFQNVNSKTYFHSHCTAHVFDAWLYIVFKTFSKAVSGAGFINHFFLVYCLQIAPATVTDDTFK